ncbi:MAG: hypothetical protein Q9191_003276 [Dirinaria sp. TL-2023a]
MAKRPVFQAETEVHSSSEDARPLLFFDIDNCLYPRSTNVQELMYGLITEYFKRHLSLSEEDANVLHERYYKDYGLAVSGLAKHHRIDPLNFNHEVDDALPLDQIIKPNPQLRKLLEDIDKTKAKLWLFTNAHITHAQRVVKLLGVEDMFEGLTYCDYSRSPLLCKPHAEMFEKAEKESGATSARECFFVDDTYLNCQHAQMRGWSTAHLIEHGEPEPETRAAKYQIRDLEELRSIFPQFFRSSSSPNGNVELLETATPSQL